MRRRDARDARVGDYWVEYEPSNLVDWSGLRVPEMFTACYPDERFRVRIEIVLEADGPVCVALSRLDHDSPPLTSGRRFPLRAMVDAAVRAAAFELVEVPIDQVDPDRSNPDLVPDERGQVRVYAPAFDDRPRPRATSERTGAPDFERVAVLYRRAVASGSPPSTAIALQFDVTPATARKWVQRARARGLLGPAVGRRPGEAAPVGRRYGE